MNHQALTMLLLLGVALLGGTLTVFKPSSSPWGLIGLLLLTIGGIGMILVGFHLMAL